MAHTSRFSSRSLLHQPCVWAVALLALGACDPNECEGCDQDGGLDASSSDGSVDGSRMIDGGLDADLDTADGGTSDGGAPDAGGPQPLKAFPAAMGGGAEASGGRGGVLIVINTPDPSVPLTHFPATAETPERYEGGLYDALEFDGAAYIIFDRSMNIRQGVGGTGTLARFSGLGLRGVHDKTVFGQSAPQGGITITGGTFTFNGRSEPTRNLVFRYFRSRPILNQDGVLTTEPDLYTWGMLFRSGDGIVVDHCSFSFTQDKGLGGGVREGGGNTMERVTFSRNFVGDTFTGIFVAVGPGRAGSPEESVDRISFLSNMTVGMNRTPNAAFDGFAEVINSVVYGRIYKASTLGHELRINFLNNYYLVPGEPGRSGFNRVFDWEDSGVPRIFARGNVFPGLLTGASGENNQVMFKYRDEYDSEIDPIYFVDEPFDSPDPHRPVATSADEALASVVTNGNIGAYRYLDDEGRAQTYRDSYDTTQLDIVRTRSDVVRGEIATWVLPVIPETTRPGSYDTDLDGMADAWEMRVIGSLDESYADDHDDDGYENIEEYMNQVDE